MLYRVTPVFEGEELIARDVQMEAWSIKDNGEGICFNIFCFHVQPGIEIDYAPETIGPMKQPAATKLWIMF